MTLAPDRPLVKPARRLAQVDARRRITISEAEPSTVYTIEFRFSDDAIILTPLSGRRQARRINMDARRRFQASELRPHGLYFVSRFDNGAILMVPAVAITAEQAKRLALRSAS